MISELKDCGMRKSCSCWKASLSFFISVVLNLVLCSVAFDCFPMPPLAQKAVRQDLKQAENQALLFTTAAWSRTIISGTEEPLALSGRMVGREGVKCIIPQLFDTF